MKFWSARDTVDENSQQGEGAHTTPTIEDTWASLNNILKLLLDSGQGKLTYMVARQLKLREGLIKPGPWRVHSACGLTDESCC